MADTTKGSHTNPQGVTIASTSLTGIQNISWSMNDELLQAPKADAEIYAGTPLKSGSAVSGSITFSNVLLADAAEGLSGALVATLKGMGGQGDSTLTITSVMIGSVSSQVAHGAPGSSTVSFVGYSEDGTTNPVVFS